MFTGCFLLCCHFIFILNAGPPEQSWPEDAWCREAQAWVSVISCLLRDWRCPCLGPSDAARDLSHFPAVAFTGVDLVGQPVMAPGQPGLAGEEPLYLRRGWLPGPAWTCLTRPEPPLAPAWRRPNTSILLFSSVKVIISVKGN